MTGVVGPLTKVQTCDVIAPGLVLADPVTVAVQTGRVMYWVRPIPTSGGGDWGVGER